MHRGRWPRQRRGYNMAIVALVATYPNARRTSAPTHAGPPGYANG